MDEDVYVSFRKKGVCCCHGKVQQTCNYLHFSYRLLLGFHVFPCVTFLQLHIASAKYEQYVEETIQSKLFWYMTIDNKTLRLINIVYNSVNILGIYCLNLRKTSLIDNVKLLVQIYNYLIID